MSDSNTQIAVTSKTARSAQISQAKGSPAVGSPLRKPTKSPDSIQKVLERPMNLSQIDGPSFLMAPPLSYSSEVPNNAWMRDFDEADRVVKPRKAMRQFQVLYNFIASRAFVSLLAEPGSCGLQDLVFTANLGIVLSHLPAKDTVIISNFSSAPRIGEKEVGINAFTSMGYKTFVPSHKFEGEAELKHLHSNVYIGGYGMRSEIEAFEEMEKQFGMEVIKVRVTDEYLYHLDCNIFPLTREKTMVCTEVFTKKEVASIAAHTDVIDVPKSAAIPGICNSVRMGHHILNGSNINELSKGTESYREEIAKNRLLEDICGENGMEPAFFNLSEYIKGGGALSCMVMHLNRHSYDFRLI